MRQENVYMGVLRDATSVAMNRAIEQMEAMLFWDSKCQMIGVSIASLRLPVRELRRMTCEEIESAIISRMAGVWESLPDEPPTFYRFNGLRGWL